MRKRIRSIYYRMMCTCILAVLIPFLFVSSAFTMIFVYTTNQQTDDMLKSVAGQMVKELEGVFERIENVTYALIRDRRYAEQLYNSDLSNYQLYDYVVNSLKTGVEQCQYYNQEIYRMYFLTDNPHFITTRLIESLNEIESDAWRSRYDKSYEIEWMKEILPSNYSNMQKRMQWADVPALFGVAQVFPPNSRTGFTNYVVIQLDEAELFTCLLVDNISTKLTDENGAAIYLNGESYARSLNVPIKGWNLELSADPIASGIALLVVIAFAILLVSLTISFVIFHRFGSRLVLRLKEISMGVSKVAEGDLGYSISLKSYEAQELTEIVTGFNRMGRELNNMIDKLTKTEREQKRSEIKALQAQINPHFLHNLFSLINSMAVLAKQAPIVQATLEISGYYRSLFRRESIYIRVSEEIENMRQYVRLQELLQNDGFDVEFIVPGELMDCVTVNMLLQPLIENAVEHGVSQIEGRGHIEVAVERVGCGLEFAVTDNGPGFASDIDKAMMGNSGYGMHNVHQRCQYLFGAEYGVSLRRREDDLTTVVLRIPLIRDLEQIDKQRD